MEYFWLCSQDLCLWHCDMGRGSHLLCRSCQELISLTLFSILFQDNSNPCFEDTSASFL